MNLKKRKKKQNAGAKSYIPDLASRITKAFSVEKDSENSGGRVTRSGKPEFSASLEYI